MAFHYKHFLPFKQIFQWLSHLEIPTTSFTHREFAYEYRSGAYQRYNAFSSVSEFKNSVIKANPTRFEIGAVYSVDPKQRKSLPKLAMKPLEKDLVFDIDLTDYDGVRTCCLGTQICRKCWKFITVGSQVLEHALREDFGFEHLIWVFSGRRGAHCWVSDKKARFLSEQKRRAIVEYLDVLNNPTGSGKSGSRNGLGIKRPLHPHIKRLLTILKSKFKSIILEEQDPWALDSVAFALLLPMISEKTLKSLLEDHWTKNPGRSSLEKWLDIKSVYEQNQAKHMKHFSVILFQAMLEDIIVETLYPRLDVEVSRQLIHLLKSPFCVHPGTGNVCVPFDASVMYEDLERDESRGFDPMLAPNLKQLVTELETADGDGEGWNRTSLRPYVEYFESFVNGVIKEEENEKKRKAEKMEDF